MNSYTRYVRGFFFGVVALYSETRLQGSGSVVISATAFLFGTAAFRSSTGQSASTRLFFSGFLLGTVVLTGGVIWLVGPTRISFAIPIGLFFLGVMTDWLVRIKSRSTDGNLGNPDTAVISFKYARPDSLPDGQTFEHLDRSNLDSKRIAKLERALESAKARIADFEHRPDTAISGRVFANLLRAIAAFPTRYPQYSERFPKLDSDVRPWLKESGIATNDREAHVFSSILSEHFATSPDTLKP